MSHTSPVVTPSIPEPTKDNQSLQQAVEAMKQNIEISQGTRNSVNKTFGMSASLKNILTALYRVNHP